MNELSNCPNCGNDTTRVYKVGDEYERKCKSCGFSNGLHSSVENTDEFWNHRCEEIRLGRWLGGDVPEGLQVVSVQLARSGSLIVVYLEPISHPIPQPLTQADVLREGKEALDAILREPSDTVSKLFRERCKKIETALELETPHD